MVLGSSPFVTSFTNLEGLAAYFAGPMFSNFELMVGAAVGYNFIMGKIDTVHMLYLGVVLGLTVELCAAAFLVYSAV